MFSDILRDFLETIYNTPEVLKEKHPDTKKKLKSMCGKGQGSGNHVTPQEAAFAHLLEQYEIPYIYQVRGTQRSGDFRVTDPETGRVYDFDLKHSNGMTYFLNDGTHEDGVIYIVSFTHKKQHKCLIAYGEDIMSTKDKTALAEFRADIKAVNQKRRDTDFIILRARGANRNPCKQFTTDFMETRFERVVASLFAQPAPQTEQAPHSQSV